MDSIRCLLVSLDQEVADLVRHLFEGDDDAGAVVSAPLEEALETIRLGAADLLIVGEQGLHEPGRELLREARARGLPVVLISKELPLACPHGISAVVCLPGRYLYQVVRRAIGQRRQSDEPAAGVAGAGRR